MIWLGYSFEEGDLGYGNFLKLFFFHLDIILWIVILKVLVVHLIVFVLRVIDHIRVLVLIVKLCGNISLWFRFRRFSIIIVARH